jgi:hypothetical protein
MGTKLEKDPDWLEYIKPDSKRSCDKWDHFQRSVNAQSNHLKHEKDIQRRSSTHQIKTNQGGQTDWGNYHSQSKSFLFAKLFKYFFHIVLYI